MRSLLGLSLLLPLLIAPAGNAQDGIGGFDDDGPFKLTYEKLRSPVSAPDDPKAPNSKGRLDRELSQTCRNSMKMDCFLKRHANSWEITCSLCAKATKCCSKPMRTPSTDSEILDQVKVQKKIGGKGFEMAYSTHFAVLLDHRSLKIKTRGGPPRIARKHELLHLFLQRAEMARLEFEKVFGSAYGGRSAMVLARSDGAQRQFSAQYFGNARTNVLRGYGSGNKVMAGLCGNGFSISGKSDDALHFRSRHMIGHLLITTYVTANPHPKYCPAWIDKGCAHWLCKTHPRAKNYATFCQHEGAVTTSGGGGRMGGGGGGMGGRSPGGGGGGGGGPTVSGSGANWHKKAKRIALKGPKKDPVEAMFRAAKAKEVDFELHVRGWSWFDVFIREEREPFVRFIRLLREARDPRQATKEAWGQAPELVDERWRNRVTGKRKNVEKSKKEKTRPGDVTAATGAELADLATETDLQLLAGRIRGLEKCHNVKTAKLVVALLDKRDSDRVREVIALVLARTTDEEVLAYLRAGGYERAGKMGRATLCRTFGETGDTKAIPVLRTALDDGFWLVKANAARALAALGDKESIEAIAKLAASGKGKVRIGAMDALATFGESASKTAPLFMENLKDSRWQIKVATCDALRALGNNAPVELLIDRYETEGGRVKEDVLETLQALTGMDRKWSPNTWREWWKKAKRYNDLEARSKRALGIDEKENRNDQGRYAKKKKKPHYYGIRIYARTVGYVLDISASMNQGFRVSEEWQQRLGHELKGRTRIDVCREELAYSIAKLDPRTRLNLVFFNDRARLWKKTPVAAGSSGPQAISKIKNIATKGQTNYYDALRLILGMAGGAGGWVSSFADTPDTLFFLTDGSPTDGDITDAEELLAWFNERNRFARLRVHVIAMGNTGVDTEFLANLAKMNSGTFVHLTGDY